MANGIVTGYRIRYRQSKDRRQIIIAVDGTQTRCVLAGKFVGLLVEEPVLCIGVVVHKKYRKKIHISRVLRSAHKQLQSSIALY